jgi:quercetin dioxygenase-like cupin family protein
MTDSEHESNALKILQTVEPPFLPERPQAITFTIEYPPGHPGAAPHRHPGPAFGYVVEGEMLFELEGEPERVLRAGDAFWEPGGDVIHYQDSNHSTTANLRFVVTLLSPPGAPMLTFVDADELESRHDRRAPRP